ncbi:hypothetical protein LJB42_004015 [Komagataella kurtzmanii]|nr:hypothetical protein LJB42_004015 [Komagataella kurtzmanii]
MGIIALSLLLYRLNKSYRRVSDVLVGTVFEPSKDIVLITGGVTGLGRELAIAFREKGATVVVWDIRYPEEDLKLDNVFYYQCDVSDRREVLKLSKAVREQVGVVTILINNAGYTKGKSLLELSHDEIERTIKVNLLSSFYTIKAFLPEMLKARRGYIITIGSVLGYISPARLSAYGASKSGLVALHESLTYELGPPSLNQSGVKTLLICPGQMQTRMFNGVITPSSLVAPLLDPTYVAKYIVGAVELGRRGEIKIPFYGNFLPIIRAAPWPIVELARGMSGIDASMRKFVGAISASNSQQASLLGHDTNSLESVVN